MKKLEGISIKFQKNSREARPERAKAAIPTIHLKDIRPYTVQKSRVHSPVQDG